MNTQEISLPQGCFRFSQGGKRTIAVVAGGRQPAPAWLAEAVAGYEVYAADRGITYCTRAGLVPQALYGDQDSAAEEAWEQAKEAGTACYVYPKDKDLTDLQLVLQELPAGVNVLVSGVWGGRADHLYSNLFSLAGGKAHTFAAVLLADDEELLLMLSAGETVVFMPQLRPLAISLLPLALENQVSIEGVKWPLHKADLSQLQPYAISNESSGGELQVTCHSGCVGFYMNFAKGVHDGV